MTLRTQRQILRPPVARDAAPLEWEAARMRSAMPFRCDAALGHGVEPLGRGRLTSGWLIDNRASGAAPDRLGFARTGESMQPCRARGCDVAHADMALTRAVWLAAQAAQAAQVGATDRG